MIGYGKQNINKNDIKAVVEVLNSDFLAQGPKIKEFEDKIAEYTGAKYAIAATNGTCALHLAYLVAGLSKGDEIITSPNTFAATSNMMLAVGARPVFCDIRLDTYNIDEGKIEKLINKKTKAIVPIHLAGQSCEMDKIYKIANKYKLMIIEDACHGLGGEYKNNKIGSCKYSDMSVFSFHSVKSIATGEGGAVTTNDKKLYKRLRLLRSHGIEKDKNGFNVMTELGYNYRLTDLQAALGISQLKRLDKFMKARHKVVKWYNEKLNNVDEIILPTEEKNNYSSWHIYIIRVADKKDRLPLYKFLLKNKIGVNFHYPAIYKHPYYKKLGYNKIKLNNMDLYHETAITLPCHTLLTKKDIEYISNKIKEYYERH